MTNTELKALLEQFRVQYPFSVLVGGSIAANGSEPFEAEISADAVFRSYFLTIIFTTLIAGPADGGACQITGRIFDSGRAIYLQSAETPLNLFASPGRQRTSAIAGDAGHTLFYPFPFEHTWRPASKIIVESVNGADFANTVYYLFMGEKLRVNYDDPMVRAEDL